MRWATQREWSFHNFEQRDLDLYSLHDTDNINILDNISNLDDVDRLDELGEVYAAVNLFQEEDDGVLPRPVRRGLLFLELMNKNF